MDIFSLISLLGGLAMFLYGMRLMGDSLKENSSGALKNAMSKVTDNPVKAFLLGVLVTALIQSSTATIVITSGLVGAGILTLRQSLGIIIGANVGTTVTGQIIRLLDLDASGGSQVLRFFQPSTLAPIALIIGIIFIMARVFKNSRSVGNIAIGFGILFSGLLNMTGAVNSLAQSGLVERLFSGLGENPVLGYITGAGVAFMLQSSSATVGILQAFSSTGMLTFKAIYTVIVGIYLGDCVTTAIVCSIGAKSDARRVGIVNILFNLSETVLVLVVVAVIHRLGLIDALWDRTVNSSIIANTNTVFNLTCAIVLMPMLPVYEKLSRKIVRDEPVPEHKYKDMLEALNPVFFNTPALALQSCYNTLLTIFTASRGNIEKSFRLLERYDAETHRELLAEEDEIDCVTDALSRYLVGFLPHLQLEYHVSILDQYYKVTSEFERLGDHAVKIAEHAESLVRDNTSFSSAALSELAVLESATMHILDETDQAFRKRDVDAAMRIEPLVQVIGEIITLLKRNHLVRMSRGECNVYADAAFTDLMVEFRRIADTCSNVGVATVIRVKPELADHEHLYYEHMHKGGDPAFDAAYNRAHARYFLLLRNVSSEDVPDDDEEAEEPPLFRLAELGPDEGLSEDDPENSAV
ncbi:MAG: Na/Pi cotransporter family protein [Oscillospiraceae bacterium]|nr:Na/Pi cotransporter family protein [Oscillospiraceae bacterium]